MIGRQFIAFGFIVVGLVCNGQSTNALMATMNSFLKPHGKNPVHSIQVFISRGDEIFCESVGFSDGMRQQADKDNQFKIASITKTMTAVAILQLQEEGRLSIDDKVSRYLGDIPFVRVNELSFYERISYGESITIKQLLQHSSGIADIFTDATLRFYLNEFLYKKQQWNAEKLMNRYYKYGLNKSAHFAPDSGYFYSDINYFLLGLIIEKCSGVSLAQQFRSRIFKPLNMENTYLEYYEPALGNGKIAHSFMGKMDITKILNTSYDWAGGGVVSTTTDLARFLQGLFTGKLFSNELTLRKMTTTLPHKLKSGDIKYYGLGISQMDFNGDIYFGHAGFWGSLVAYCPSQNITFCGNVNQVKPGFNTKNFIETLIRNFMDIK